MDAATRAILTNDLLPPYRPFGEIPNAVPHSGPPQPRFRVESVAYLPNYRARDVLAWFQTKEDAENVCTDLTARFGNDALGFEVVGT